MGDVLLEYPQASMEVHGSMVRGKLKFTESNILFKATQEDRTEEETVDASEVEVFNWQRLAGGWGLRCFTEDGELHRFGGLSDKEKDKIESFLQKTYNKKMEEMPLAIKGWNWGTANFKGNALTFNVGSNVAFEVPLSAVSQANTGKNEVTLEFHQKDAAAVSLMEMRFHIPPGEGDTDPVEAFHEQVMKKAAVVTNMGDALAIFRELQCLTPRGRYDIKVFSSFIQFHGKTFDFKMPITSVIRLFLLAHNDQRQMFLVLSLDPPITQGQTRYNYPVLLFSNEDDDIEIELPFTDEELTEKFAGRLKRVYNGPIYEVLAKVLKGMCSRNITVPDKTFRGHSGTPAISCSYKAASGFLYPLERGIIFVHKPVVHLRFDEIASVNFSRGGGTTRSFDFEVEAKNGTVYTFSSIEKEEYGKFYDFVSKKKLRVKTDRMDTKKWQGDGDEAKHDAYLHRMKAEGEERDDDDDEDEESDDEDFQPGKEGSDVAEEFDSAASSSGSDSDFSGGGGDSGGDKPKKQKKEKKAKSPQKREAKKKSTKSKSGAPKRPQGPYFSWMNENRAKINKEYPGMGVAEFGKKAGELWKEVSEDIKKELQAKYDAAKPIWEEEVRQWKADHPEEATPVAKAKATKTTKTAKTSPTAKKSSTSSSKFTGATGGGVKSKEFIEDSDSSSSDSDKEKKPSKPKKKPEKKPEKSKKESSGSGSGSGSGSASDKSSLSD